MMDLDNTLRCCLKLLLSSKFRFNILFTIKILTVSYFQEHLYVLVNFTVVQMCWNRQWWPSGLSGCAFSQLDTEVNNPGLNPCSGLQY